MRRIALIQAAALMLVIVGAPVPARAQAPTGTIVGLARDATGAAAAGAEILVRSDQTGLERRAVADESGRFAVPILPPGNYTVEGRRLPLRSRRLEVLVQAGLTATIDLSLGPDVVAEATTVTATLRPRTDSHQVVGWVDRGQIEHQPLNGRSIFELVKVEPGLTTPVRLSGGRVFVASLGGGLQTVPRVGFTRLTLDGANIETPGTVGTLLQVSPETVDQMQVATVNFDPSIGLATSGSINVITRSGGDRYRARAFWMYRDQRWSASPAASFGSGAADPSFGRHQAGGSVSGPLKAGRAFFDVGYERHSQRDLIAVLPTDPALQAFGGTFPSPYSATLVSARIDLRMTDRHRAFLRHTRDDNVMAATPDGPQMLPSAWTRRPVMATQTLGALTSILTEKGVNDLRVSYFATRSSLNPLAPDACAAPCVGLGAPRIVISDGAATALGLGNSALAAQTGSRFQVSDAFVWQSGSHLLRFGVDWEYTRHSQYLRDSDPAQLTLWAPEAVRLRAPSVPLPASFSSLDDLLRLPLRSFTTSVGPGEVLQAGFQPFRTYHTLRGWVSDRWSIGSAVAVTAGLAWAHEPGAINADLAKPAWLSPLVGADGLRVPAVHDTLSGSVGMSWRVDGAGRTILRAGVGQYADSVARTVAVNLATERVQLSPLGVGRLVVSGSNLVWDGRRLNFPVPTTFTGADLLAALPSIRAALAQSLNPGNRDFSYVNLDRTKEGRNLYDPAYTTPRSLHASVGVERQVRDTLIVSADVVWKRFSHTFINGIDYNRFFSIGGPVIPACTPSQAADITAACSNGSLYFDTTSGRARYGGVLVRVDQRFAGAARLLASYAYGRFDGSNGTGTATSENPNGRVFGFNNDDWTENEGPLPTDLRHVLNVSGLLVAPWKINVSFNLAAYSRAPFTAYIAGLDFNGDGTTNDLLPGTRVNQFNRGLDRDDLVRLVADYNENYAGRLTVMGQRAPFVTLPAEFEFNDHFFTLDIRIARAFSVGSRARIEVLADIFNVLDTMNLTGYGGNLLATSSFGKPTGRVGQAFGSGGPRAGQVGIRVGF